MGLSKFFDRRANLMVPNVSWGFGVHECDILLVTKAGYGVEVEIKVSAADLKKDVEKYHKHSSRKLKLLYFAIPFYLEPLIPFIPAHAGVVSCKKIKPEYKNSYPFLQCSIIREAQDSPEWVEHGKYKFTESDLFKVARLGVFRMWDLRETNQALARENREYAAAEDKGSERCPGCGGSHTFEAVRRMDYCNDCGRNFQGGVLLGDAITRDKNE